MLFRSVEDDEALLRVAAIGQRWPESTAMARRAMARVSVSRKNRERARSRERGEVRREERSSSGASYPREAAAGDERVELERGSELGVSRAVATARRRKTTAMLLQVTPCPFLFPFIRVPFLFVFLFSNLNMQ